MSATNLAFSTTKASASAQPAEATIRSNTPKLVCRPLLQPDRTRQFVRVPTHAVGVHPEHREYPRASLKLPLKLESVNGQPEASPVTLVTRDISSSGVYFLCPKALPVDAAIDLQIVLISRPMGHGNVVMASKAHVRRVHDAAMPGWYGIAATFDDVSFDRDDFVPQRFMGL
jgi:PilZ domain-containing protein